MRFITKAAVVFFMICITSLQAQAVISVRDSVLKIYTVYNEDDYYNPWQMHGQETRFGSGCIIEGQKILTNAHVVANQTFIQVKRAGYTKKYVAKVEIVAHKCDLAILSIEDKSFFKDSVPLKIGELASVRDKVAVYGFPKGGEELTFTEGVVSRIEHNKYAHSQASLLTCQIDAAINPGSSGGPVMKDGKIIGIAFQGGGGENVGFIIPVPVIKHFLNESKDGYYNGIPDIGISVQKMENPDMRLKYGMQKGQTGVLINAVYPASAAKDLLFVDDIILAIDGEDVENDGTIEFRKNERTSFSYIIQNRYINETSVFKILRDKQVIEVPVKLTETTDESSLVQHDQFDIRPSYYIVGGLVFEPLTLNFLKEWGRRWRNRAPENLVNYYLYGEPSEEVKSIVVLVQVLADNVNIGYHDLKYNVIRSVNGKQISDVSDLVDAFEKNKGKYHVVEDEHGFKIIMDRIKVNKSKGRILKRYKIDSDRSQDL